VQKETTSRPSIIDALTTGLVTAARRPWLLLVPFAIDLLLWLAPKVSIAALMQRLLRGWETLVRATYSASQLEVMAEMLETVREGMTRLGAQVNLLDTLAGSWLGPPSAVATDQVSRLNFISELILAPVGLIPESVKLAAAPWQAAPVEVQSFLAVMLLMAALWGVAQVVAVCWLRWAAAAVSHPAEATPPATPVAPAAGGWTHGAMQALQLIGFCLFLGILMFALRLPLGAAVVLLLLSGSPLTGLMFALVAGVTLWITLWMLLSLYFTSEGLLFERQPVWRSMLQGATMMRGNITATLGLISLVNLLLVGFRAVWGIIGQTPAGGVIALAGNAYLATAMLLAIFTYYGGLRKQWLAAVEKQQAGKQVDK
jgi:hypothetical protein